MVRAMVLMVTVLVAACGPSMVGDDPEADPETVFEQFWEDFDRYYAHFQIKDVDWDAMYQYHRPRVGPATTDDELFEVLSDMIVELEDGHVYLAGDKRRALSSAHLRSSRRDFDATLVRGDYLDEPRSPTEGGEFFYGTIGDDIGYLRVATLSGGEGVGDNVKGWVEGVEKAVGRLTDTRGMVVDLRNNSGGRAFNAKFIAGLFATERRPFMITRSRSGPNHDDFTPPRYWHAEPNGGVTYDNPVVVLTNRASFSAAEWLTLGLRQYDHVVHMGTHTGGGLAMFLPRQLPNGWMVTVSVQDARGPEGRSFERVGIPPQQYLENGDRHLEEGRDMMLEQAVEYLERR